ncbi:uncharacterized protein VICG_01322 [Vittaforma corneae ATCC 50505]|uniref:Uncharacterized protein n=1 Tax=Vittaforma corneae (strain ATCC 50505) TaxID=993615 RepID=L2GM39_VITCO|nr:uncharacterized protein VICG_01322 [Vittaforma corneae ATCC 50505]ELA41689.1 hypothetical protein VICG_01322 [Vittaforma corneae ATCC 50505]
MARDHTSKCELEVRINIADDPNDLLAIYRENNAFFQEVISKLLNLRKYSHFSIVWSEASAILSQDSRSLILALNLIRCNAKELCQAEEADFLIRSLLDLALQYSNTFEAFKICQTISELIVQNKQFPSKAMAILYFQIISSLFKASSNAYSYLNALHLLNELEPINIRKGEFEFLKELAMAKSEPFAKDLFCDIRPREVNAISVGLETSEYVFDEKIRCILDAFKTGSSLENSFSNVAFLLKNSIPFTVDQNIVKLQKASSEGFTSIIFNITNQYVPDIIAQEPVDMQTKEPIEKKKAIVAKDKEEVVVPTRSKTEFKNRFTVPYKRSKLFKMYMPVRFEDIHYSERNARREEFNTSQMDEKLREREFLLSYKDVVEDLINELRRLQETKANNERQVLLEKAKEDEERIRQEQRSKMWRVQGKTEQQNLECLENKSSVNFIARSTGEPIHDGIYVPKFSTLNYTSSNIAEIAEKAAESAYRPPIHFSYKKDVDKKESVEQGSWRKKRLENTKN